MANIIILEGLSRTGKSSISKILSDKYKALNISYKDKMPEYVKNLPDFYHGIHLTFSHIVKQFPNETFILDRSFISELVYSKFFKRNTYENQGNLIEDLLFNNNFVIAYFSSTYRNYLDRNPKDRIIYSEKDFIQQKDLFDWYYCKYKDLNESEDWQSRFTEIDTNTTSMDNTIQIIENLLEQNNFIKNVLHEN
jgi:thymidylate kinase